MLLPDRARTRKLLGLGAALVLLACQPAEKGRDSVPARDVKTVMEAHVDDLMAMPGVVGIAIGQLDDGTPSIQVLVVRMTPRLQASLPATLEGHPVDVIVSGEIRPLGDE